MKKLNSYNFLIASSISIWMILFVYGCFVENGFTKISSLAAKIEFVFHFFSIYILIKICKKVKGKQLENIFWLLAVNFIFLVIDALYYAIAYTNSDISEFVKFLLDKFPGMIGCIFIIYFLVTTLLNGVLPYKKFIKLSMVFILADFIIMWLFLSSLGFSFELLDWRKTTEIFTLSAQIIQYNFAIVGLIYAINISAIFLLVGLVILLASAYIYISNILNLFPYAEMVWLLGILFLFFNTLSIKRNQQYDFYSWFRKENTIKSELAFWSFSISMSGFLLFFCIAYSFSIVDKTVFMGLPLFIMMYSIIAVTLSIFMGRKFEAPFIKIGNNIEQLKQSDKKLKVNNDFSIEEFIYLQKFITNAFAYKEEKDKAKKQIGEITAQVAHDIRSPLAAIDTIMGTSENREISESEKNMVRTALRRINNITNDLVAKYKGKHYDPNTLVFVYVAIKDIVSEKDLEYSGYNINFNISLDNEESAFLLTSGNYKEIHRMLSNLINNSVNAMEEGGDIKIACSRKNNNIIVKIIDQGVGIAEKKIRELLSDDKNFNIGNEIGFGLKHAKNYLKKHNGSIEIRSKENCGTEIMLSFPVSSKPNWLAEKLEIDFENQIIVIDDDVSIHNIWIKKFEGVNINKKDFYTTKKAREYLADHKINRGVILCDYEFIGSDENGLDFLKKINGTEFDKYLVTTHVDNFNIIESCEKNNFKLIPKHLLPYIIIHRKEVNKLSIENACPDVVLIDDETYNHEFWQYRAKKTNKVLNCYHSLEDFMIDEKFILKNIPIYIDLDLNGKSGIDVAKKLNNNGYNNIYITTGFSNIDIKHHPYIVEIIGKKPPF